MTPASSADVSHQVAPRVSEPAFSIAVELNHVNSSGIAAPSKARVDLDDELLRTIAHALVFIEGGRLQPTLACMVIPMPGDPLLLGEGGDEWDVEGGDNAQSDRTFLFKASSSWLSIGSDRLEVRIWDKYGDDELVGFVEFRDHVGLRSRIAELQPEERRQLIERLGEGSHSQGVVGVVR